MKLRAIAILAASVLVSACLGGGGGVTQGQNMPTLYPWMNAEIADAWAQGYRGQGSRITVVDEFIGADTFHGNLRMRVEDLTHGEWVAMHAGLIAPDAQIFEFDYGTDRAISLSGSRLDIVNLSFGIMLPSIEDFDLGVSRLARSIVDAATNADAVIVKAAGNDAIALDGMVTEGMFDGTVDVVNIALIGMESVIFAGALDRNGSPDNLARLADYSNFAGTNVTIQNQFLTVGVARDQTGLAGTSFAAPIISGYAAVLGSKFTDATPTQIARQLLDTARQDTIHGYDPALHGRGEASITRALAPASIR